MTLTKFRVRQISIFIILISFHISIKAQVGEAFFDVSGFAWSPDGTTIAVGGGACNEGLPPLPTIYLLDAETLAQKGQLTGSGCRDILLDWSPDGTRLAESGIDGYARIWDIENEVMLSKSYYNPSGRTQISWSPDGSMIANILGEHYVFEAWSSVNPSNVISFLDSPITSTLGYLGVTWSPDGTQLATAGSDNMVKIWDVSTRSVTARLQHSAPVLAVDWRPDGTQIASSTVEERVFIWDAETYEVVNKFEGKPATLQWHPFEPLLLGSPVADQTTVMVWNAESGEAIERYESNNFRAPSAWSPYGGRIIYSKENIEVDENGLNARENVFANGSLEIVVPNPSIERLNATIAYCLDADYTIKDLSKIVSLPDNQLPAGCKADILAIADAISD